MGRVTSNFFWPQPLGPWKGIKRSNIFQFQLKSQFQRFLYQTLCVFSQMKDTKHIRRDFMPQGGTFGRSGCPGGKKKSIKHGHVAYQIDGDDEQNASKIFILGSNW